MLQSTYPKCPCCDSTSRTRYYHPIDVQKHGGYVNIPPVQFNLVAFDVEADPNAANLFVCQCGAIYGDVTSLHFTSLVVQRWAPQDAEAICADFTFRRIDNGQLDRWHGWIDQRTRQIVQVG